MDWNWLAFAEIQLWHTIGSRYYEKGLDLNHTVVDEYIKKELSYQQIMDSNQIFVSIRIRIEIDIAMSIYSFGLP